MPHALLLFASVCLVALTAAEPSAHAPAYDQAGLWPADVQKAAYCKESWPVAKVYVWATMGDGKQTKGGPETDPKDPAHWTADGAPATTAPGVDDDVLFPTGAAVRLKENTTLRMRHLTIEPGTRIPDSLRLRPVGNTWLKKGAGTGQLVMEFTGGKNVFLRNDNTPWQSEKAWFANKIMFNKAVGSSIEVVGSVKVGDEMCFMKGTVVVGPGAELVPGNRSTQPIYPDATLVLLSGSTFQKRGNQPYSDDLVVSGTLLAGTPERPLTSDCRLGLSFKTKGVKGLVENKFKEGGPRDYGMVVNPGGRLKVHSADPAKARLVITWNGLNSLQHAGAGKPDPVPRSTDLVLQGQVDLAGVLFDYIRPGGILLADPAIRSKGLIAFGEHNLGKPDELFAPLEKPIEAKLLISFPPSALDQK